MEKNIESTTNKSDDGNCSTRTVFPLLMAVLAYIIKVTYITEKCKIPTISQLVFFVTSSPLITTKVNPSTYTSPLICKIKYDHKTPWFYSVKQKCPKCFVHNCITFGIFWKLWNHMFWGSDQSLVHWHNMGS